MVDERLRSILRFKEALDHVVADASEDENLSVNDILNVLVQHLAIRAVDTGASYDALLEAFDATYEERFEEKQPLVMLHSEPLEE
jgi:hypothetical protein